MKLFIKKTWITLGNRLKSILSFTKSIVEHTLLKTMILQNRLKELRARDNLTQEELAGRVGVTRQTILAIEKGENIPSLELGLKISHVFQLPVEQVFMLVEEFFE